MVTYASAMRVLYECYVFMRVLFIINKGINKGINKRIRGGSNSAGWESQRLDLAIVPRRTRLAKASKRARLAAPLDRLDRLHPLDPCRPGRRVSSTSLLPSTTAPLALAALVASAAAQRLSR